MRIFIWSGVFAIGLASAIAAQGTADAHGGICFRGKPQPECSSFPLIEFGAYLRLDTPRQDDQRYMMTFDLGWMRNVTARDAIGVSALLAVYGQESDADGFMGGAALRYRRWLNRRSSVALSLGSPLTGEMELGDPKFPSLMSEVKWSYGDWLALSARLEHTRYERLHYGCAENLAGWYAAACWNVLVPDEDTALYIGAELGAYTGIVGFLAGAAIVVLDFLANISS